MKRVVVVGAGVAGLSAAHRIRRRHFGNTVQLYFLMNAKSGLCPEDCSYCSQSKVSDAEIPKYNILSRDKLLDGARIGARSLVAAGAVVTPRTVIPPGSMVVGTPAKVLRPLSEAEQASLKGWAEKYLAVSAAHAQLATKGTK